jgi:putative MATE family efflux protein
MTTQALSYTRSNTLQRQVFRLALPAVGEQFLNMLVGLVDTYLVGNISLAAMALLGYGPAEGLTSVGLASNIIWIVTTLFSAGAVGGTALIARATGARNNGEANATLRQSVILGLLMGLIGFGVMYGLAPTALRLFGAEPTVVRLGVNFLRIVSFSMPLAGVMFMCNAALRGAGDTRTPLLIMFLVNGINMVISWLLVNGQPGFPTLGVAGSAWGTMLARMIGGLVVVAVLVRGRGMLRLDRWPRAEWGILGRITRIGFPTAGELFIFQAALILFARFIAGLGTVPYAAHNTVITAESISFLPGFGFAIAATTLVGQSLGAQEVKRARHSGHEAYLQSAVFMGFMGLLFVLFPGWFLSILTRDQAVVEAGILPLRMVGVVQPLLAANFVYAGALRGAGDTLRPLLIKLIVPWLVRLPLAFVLIPMLGLNGAWLAMSIDLGLQGVLAWWFFRGGKWERITV